MLTCASAGVLLAATLAVAACTSGPRDGQAEWVLVQEPSGRTLELQARFGGSSCTEFEGWVVEESPAEVDVRALITNSGDGDCTADLVSVSHTLHLSEPLGERELLGCAPDDVTRNCAELASAP